MDIKSKLVLSTLASLVVLIVLATPIFLLDNGDSKYFRYGWHDDLVLISVPINTGNRYFCAVLFVVIIRIGEVLVQEVAYPIVSFNIYNPDKKEVEEFSKNELQFFGNTLYLIEGIRGVFKTMTMVTQIDIALISVLAGELISIVTIRMLLNEKTFKVKPHKKLTDVEYQLV
tara:strand:- start:1987 stop:2502 length:516 start_codon:yes stop_codon:yes gene_type:complete